MEQACLVIVNEIGGLYFVCCTMYNILLRLVFQAEGGLGAPSMVDHLGGGAGLAHAAQQHRHLGCLAPGDVVIPEPGTSSHSESRMFGIFHNTTKMTSTYR